MSVPAWLPKWTNEPALLVAAGPTAKRETAETARRLGCRVCVVNRSWELAPWADLMYGADLAFWAHHKGVPGFAGLKVTSYQGMTPAKPFANLNDALAFVNRHDIRCVGIQHDARINWDGEPVGHGGHSGFQLLNLALLTGADPILLDGYDYTDGHWHDEHPKGLGKGPDNRAHWAGNMDRVAKDIRKRGRTVVNLSPATRMTGFPTRTIADALRLLAS